VRERLARGLADDVPQRDLHAAERDVRSVAEVVQAAAGEAQLEDPLDPQRVLADDDLADRRERLPHERDARMAGALADPRQALVRLDLDEGVRDPAAPAPDPRLVLPERDGDDRD